ncbi:MAG: hypothetical protein A2X36_13705 [Elusimicrobia bacterium GWA2_69_24]|nr:MAG: hypothetical protein A2X36_13705 [Elusimicrobia bacterium GWA2_69_24]HBL19055.1 hypothetical protein [Elusimicrobiota bacterium]
MRYLIGAGTYAAFDDSIGLRIVEHVAEKGLERGFSAVDLSAGALALMPYLDKTTEHILLVDTAKMGLAPGSYLFFAPEQVVSRKPLGGISTHEDDILKVLELARATGHHIPPITLMGIEPETVRPGFGLSPVLAERFAGYVAEAVARIGASPPRSVGISR